MKKIGLKKKYDQMGKTDIDMYTLGVWVKKSQCVHIYSELNAQDISEYLEWKRTYKVQVSKRFKPLTI